MRLLKYIKGFSGKPCPLKAQNPCPYLNVNLETINFLKIL